MKKVTAAEARESLDSLIGEAAESHEPVLIAADCASAVLVSEDDWRAVQETLCLSAVPGMCESIVEGMDTPACDCKEGLDW